MLGSSWKNAEGTRSLGQQDAAVFADLCEWNGLEEDTALREAASVTALEMFMFNFPRMRALHAFPNLTHLTIMQQSITAIEGLEACPELIALWLCENRLLRIEGLEGCRKLRRLYLHSNRLTRIENLASLTALEHLWLANNDIRQVEGLETLSRLKELSLASNPISRLGDTLAPNTALETLNLSATEIGSFKQIASLARLPRLVELSFADPQWGEAPVAGLCNYATYVLFNLATLNKLDTALVDEEPKAAAEATYMKKKMYYNMRIKTLRRSTSNAIKLSREGKQTKVARSQGVLAALVRLQKDVEREAEEAAREPRCAGTPSAEQWCEKATAIQEAARRSASEIDATERSFEEARRRAYELADLYVKRLLVELETGGNIRLEDGKPSDLWYSSCVDLLQSRFFASDYAALGITGLRVVKVTRIHNRFLRNRFESHLEAKVDTSSSSYKRLLEYLFYGENPQLPGELIAAIEEGFRPSADYLSMGQAGAVRLSNSVGVADLPRLQASLNSASASGSPAAARQLLTGQLLVTKVFLGTSTQDGDSKRRPGSATRDEMVKSAPISQAAYPLADSVYKLHPADAKQRTWFVFDSALILPEYLVEFEYEVQRGNGKLGAVLAAEELRPDKMEGPSCWAEKVEADVRVIARPLAPFLEPVSTPAGGRLHLGKAADTCVDDRYLAMANCQPVLPARPKAYLLAEDVILRQAGCSELNQVAYLNLHNNAIRKLEALSNLKGLRTLILSFNEIVKMENLEGLTALERLDLSYNYLKRIEGLKGLTQLTHLDLSNNQIYPLEDVAALKKMVPGLLHLNLRHNTVAENKSYRSMALRRLPSLLELDGTAVTDWDRAQATLEPKAMTVELVRKNSFSRRRSSLPLPLESARSSSSSGSHSSGGIPSTRSSEAPAEDGGSRSSSAKTRRSGASSPEEDAWESDKDGGVDLRCGSLPFEAAAEEDSAWCEGVEEVVLEHRKLRRIAGLDKLVNLRRLSLCDNEIAVIEGLDNCPMLEELNLEDNKLTKVEGLEALPRLRKLELGKNRLTACERLACLTQLTQLSIEDNEITSLRGLASLTGLLELYAGNNKLRQLRELQMLRELPKLIIVDLSGNLLCSEPEYRSYAIYHLKKLKVLDGLGIDASEQNAARARYTGLITRDMLEEKVGHTYLDQLQVLDLSSQRVRDCGSVFRSVDLANLTELNLDCNQLSDVAALRSLSQVIVLRLNQNRIEGGPLFDTCEGNSSPRSAQREGTIYGSLEVLQLGGNGISNLASLGVRRFTKLKVLFLQDNDLTRVDGLEGAAMLEELVLDRNRIKYIDPPSFAGTARLRELRLEENGLRSLAHMGPLPSLQSLHVGANRLSELQELDRLLPLTSLVELTLANNQLARRQVYRLRVIRKLRTLNWLDGKEISLDEREQADVLYTGPNENLGVGARDSPAGYPGTGTILGSKVPIRVTAVSFEGLLGGIPANGLASGHRGAASNTFSYDAGGLGTAEIYSGVVGRLSDYGSWNEKSQKVGGEFPGRMLVHRPPTREVKELAPSGKSGYGSQRSTLAGPLGGSHGTRGRTNTARNHRHSQ